MNSLRAGWPASARLAAAAALVSLLPHLRAAVPGLTYYFRDFTLTFYPLRTFFTGELRQGRWPVWNPYVNEGTFVLPSLYPLDFLNLIRPGAATVSWLLTLHYPLAALGAYALARELGAERRGAFVAGAVYSLGGLAASSLNLYVFLQALAWAPLVVLSLARASARGGRAIPVAGLVVAVAVSTLALEFVGPAVALGIGVGVIGLSPPTRLLRLALAMTLGIGLAALPVAGVLGVLGETPRGQGFSVALAMHNDVHPLSLLQVLVPGLFGSLSTPLEHWWGGRFFSSGGPYFGSLHLGALVLALASVGIAGLDRRFRVLLLAGLLGLWFALGSWGGLAPVLSPLPLARWFRYPSKALLLPYLVVAVAAGFGADRLSRALGWSRFVWCTNLLAVLAAGLGLLPILAPDSLAEWLALAPQAASEMTRAVPAEGAVAALIALAGSAVAWSVLKGRLAAPLAGLLIVGLAVADLVRGAAGINPQTSAAFFEALPGVSALGLDDLDGGRVFSFGPYRSPRFRQLLDAHVRGIGLWSFFVARQVLIPLTNVLDRVESADAIDRTSFNAHAPALIEGQDEPRFLGHFLPQLRNAAVSRVLSLDPLADPGLRLLARIPAGAPGIVIYAYELISVSPRAYLACRAVQVTSPEEALALALGSGLDPSRDVALESPAMTECRSGRVARRRFAPGEEHYEVAADGAGLLVMRDSFAKGWNARVDGLPAPVLRANGKHRAVPVAGGQHTVVLTYHAPGQFAGVTCSVLALLVAVGFWLRPVLTSPRPPVLAEHASGAHLR